MTTVKSATGTAMALLLLSCLPAMTSCGSGPDNQPTVRVPDSSDAPVGLHQCKVKADTARPMLVEWPATEKAALQASSDRGVVVVSYDGCRLRMLDACSLEGAYEFHETSRSMDGFTVTNRNELYAKLPLGAVSLQGEIDKGHSLKLSYVAVGTRTTEIARAERDQLVGTCDGATHYVRTMIVGAYELASEASLDVGASVEVGPAGLGGGHGEAASVIRSDGDLTGCADRATPADDPGCAAVVQLVLVPVSVPEPVVPPPAPVSPVAAPAPAPAPAPKAEKPRKEPVAQVEAEPIFKGGSGSFELIYHESYCAGNVQIIPFTDVDPMAKRMLKKVRKMSYCSTKGPFMRRFESHAAATRWVEKQTWGEDDDF